VDEPDSPVARASDLADGWMQAPRFEKRRFEAASYWKKTQAMGTRLYVGNLSFGSTADSVRSEFARCGEVTDVHLVTDRMTGQSRGFAFVTMSTQKEADAAIQAMNGQSLDGRSLRVNEAEERPARAGGGGGGGGGGGERRNRW
jgi:cold-inducible RNA-binding protein